MPVSPVRLRHVSLLFPVCLLALAACGSSDADKSKGGGPGGPGGPATVGYIVVSSSAVPLATELAGRTAAFEISEVRPQVSGVIRQRAFTEGTLVKAGQTLYQIDPSLYQSAAAEAQANLANAAATREAARVRAQRYRPLAQIEAISKQDYTDAQATERQAAAQVAVSNAQLETARINLRYTRVPAPITGRIGRSLATVGALVTANQTDPLTIIQRLDPIYVDMQQSSSDLLMLRRALARDGVTPASAEVRLKLEDGSDYGVSGTVQFTETVVDPSTGAVTLRARFANPQGLLLPGMFVRASFVQQIDSNAILVPQQAVTRDPKGGATVLLVGPGNKAVLRNIVANRTQGANWVVTSGLKPGDKVITQGTGKARPGQPIKPVPANSPQRVQAPPKDGAKGGAPAQAK